MRTVNDANMTEPRVKVESCRIDLKHEGDNINVTAKLKVTNLYPEAINHFVFSLNPGLKLVKPLSTGTKFHHSESFN